MMDFIYNLYQNDNFTLYLSIALVVLVVLFVIVLIFGKKDQKLEETKRLQKIEMDSFKEENKEPVKVEAIPTAIEEVKVEEPVVEIKENEAKEENVTVTTFEPVIKEEAAEQHTEEKVEPVVEEPKFSNLFADSEEEKPISMNELSESTLSFDDNDLEKDLNELESIKKAFDEIKVNSEESSEEKKENTFKPSPVFSSVFVNKEEPIVADIPNDVTTNNETETVTPVEPMENTMKLFTIEEDEEDMELPTLKIIEEDKPAEPVLNEQNEEKSFNFDDVSGETYNIK